MRERLGEDSLCWLSRGTPNALLGAPVCGVSTSACGGPSRILSSRAAIPSESSLSSSPSLPSSSSGDSSSDSPFCLDFTRRFLSACRSRFFFFAFFFSKSFADFCFSADSRLLSRSASSSFTRGLKDRALIEPCENRSKSWKKTGKSKIE